MFFNEGEESALMKSRNDTKNHIQLVEAIIAKMCSELIRRGHMHDASKLESPEVEIFAKYGPKLAKSTYGSEDYKHNLDEMKIALDHHYKNNSHHPEHFTDGMAGMSLYDIVELMADWKASSTRHDDGDLLESIEINQKRFGYDDMLKSIFINTAKFLYKYRVEIRYVNEYDALEPAKKYIEYYGDSKDKLLEKIKDDDLRKQVNIAIDSMKDHNKQTFERVCELENAIVIINIKTQKYM